LQEVDSSVQHSLKVPHGTDPARVDVVAALQMRVENPEVAV
jgi:uncharacterized protein YcnI